MTKFGDPRIVKNKIMSYLQIDEHEYDDFINKSLKKYNAVIAGGWFLFGSVITHEFSDSNEEKEENE